MRGGRLGGLVFGAPVGSWKWRDVLEDMINDMCHIGRRANWRGSSGGGGGVGLCLSVGGGRGGRGGRGVAFIFSPTVGLPQTRSPPPSPFISRSCETQGPGDKSASTAQMMPPPAPWPRYKQPQRDQTCLRGRL